jgi:acyl carrier protein
VTELLPKDSMTDREILDIITVAIKRIAPKKAQAFEGVNLEHLKLSGLGLDSIAMIELVTAIEADTGVTFHDHELVGIDSITELVKLIQFKKAAKLAR